MQGVHKTPFQNTAKLHCFLFFFTNNEWQRDVKTQVSKTENTLSVKISELIVSEEDHWKDASKWQELQKRRLLHQ